MGVPGAEAQDSLDEDSLARNHVGQVRKLMAARVQLGSELAALGRSERTAVGRVVRDRALLVEEVRSALHFLYALLKSCPVISQQLLV